jgi:hypothetical protein
MLKALNESGTITSDVLRVLDTLRKDEWIAFDEALVEEGVIRLRGVGDLIERGLRKTIPNGLGKTMLEYEKVNDMNPAEVSLDGMAKTEGDRLEFVPGNLPLPITHKDFFLNLRTLLASRSRGEGLDTAQARVAGRLVAEKVEHMLFNGGPQFGGNPIYGYINHPNRNTVGFGTNGHWGQAAKTGADILADVQTMISLMEGDRFFSGPYMIYVPAGASVKLDDDFKANGDKTVRQRVLEVDRVAGIKVADQMPANTVVMVQLTSDVVQLVEGEPLQTIQWDIEGGFQVNFKAFTIQVPLIRADAQGRSGVVHMS